MDHFGVNLAGWLCLACSCTRRAQIRCTYQLFPYSTTESFSHLTKHLQLFQSDPRRFSLPSSFRILLDYAFESRPWWTPGSTGVPSIFSISNRQAVASGVFFTCLKGLNWASCSFIERGQILLLIFIGAIQIETGRVKSKEGNPPSESPAHVFADCLRSFGKVLEGKLHELCS